MVALDEQAQLRLIYGTSLFGPVVSDSGLGWVWTDSASALFIALHIAMALA